MKITVSKHFQDLIFPLTSEELTVLEQSILKHGVRDPLVVWQAGRNYLLDGHHRWGIIRKNQISKYKVVNLKFNNKHEAINWMLDNQLGRRNASPEAVSYLRGLRYRHEKLSPHRPKKGENGETHSALRTSERLAQQYKITSRTIYNDEKFADAIETISQVFTAPKKQKDIKHKILTRYFDLSKKDIIELSNYPPKFIKEVVDGTKEFWQVRSDHNKNKKANRLQRAAKLAMPKDIKLYVGDCMALSKKHLKPKSIDCIITDSPFADMACYDKLGQIAQQVLKPSSFCCTYIGTMYLPQVIDIMSKYLEYYWQVIMLHKGSDGTKFKSQTLHGRKVDTAYKSILVFQKPPFKKVKSYFLDVIKGSGIEKSIHPWQQSEKELHTIVDKFSDIGSTILDPFNGSGTTGVVAKKLGRKYIGIDIDADCIKESKIRIRNVVNVETAIKAKKKKAIKSNIKFYQGDCRVIIPKHKLFEKADIAIFDPVYNQNLKYDICKDNLPVKTYISMLSIFQDFPCAIVHYPEQSMSMVYEAMQKEPSKVISWNYNSNLNRNYRLISCFNCIPDFSKSPQPYDSAYDSRVQEFVIDGKTKPLRDWWDDIGIVKNVSKEKTEHPCPLPEELCLRLLRILSDEGQTVLDPFAGSGSMAVSCKRSGRHCISVELSQNYIDIAKKRIRMAEKRLCTV